MPKQNSLRVARAAQHLLPVGLLLVAFLELSALISVQFDTLDVGGVASLLGPASYLSVSLAVVWVAFLPPTRMALLITVLTAVGVVIVNAGKGVLAVAWLLAGDDAPGWSIATLLVSGVLLGLGLCAWGVVDSLATRSALAGVETHAAAGSATSSVTPAAAPMPPAIPMRAPAPGHRPVTARPVPPAPPPLWESVSTPWPRRDESDPDGTLIRPPLKQRHSR